MLKERNKDFKLSAYFSRDLKRTVPLCLTQDTYPIIHLWEMTGRPITDEEISTWPACVHRKLKKKDVSVEVVDGLM